MMKVDCPYCKKETSFDPCEMDHDGGKNEAWCEHCDKGFVVYLEPDITATSAEAPCMDDEDEHDWKPTGFWNLKRARMKCSYCDETKQLSEEDLETHFADKKEKDPEVWKAMIDKIRLRVESEKEAERVLVIKRHASDHGWKITTFNNSTFGNLIELSKESEAFSLVARVYLRESEIKKQEFDSSPIIAKLKNGPEIWSVKS